MKLHKEKYGYRFISNTLMSQAYVATEDGVQPILKQKWTHLWFK
jgi:hypothetical protein